MKGKAFFIIFFTFAFLNQVLGHDSLKTKMTFRVYPSVQTMYGIGFYKINTGYYKQPTLKYYNQNFNVGVYVNGDWRIKPDISIQFYVGYNRWLQANLFPIGLMVKPKLNKKKNEFYLKIGGGFTLGKRYDDVNEPWLASSMPRKYGNGSLHFQAGLEKNWHLSGNKSLSAGFLLNIQYIKSYFSENYQAYVGSLQSYFIGYKFGGLTLAYHFN